MKYYEGYGKRYTVAGWARVLGLPYMTTKQYLCQGMAPEEIAKKRRVQVRLEAGTRKNPKVGPRQIELREQVEELLDRSGYDPEGVEVVSVGNAAYRLQVEWNGMVVGRYNPYTDTFKLTGEGEMGLRSPYIEEQTIFHKGGKWYPTEETKQAVRQKFMRELRRKV